MIKNKKQNIKLILLDIKNSSQAIKNQNQAKYSPNLKKSSNQEIKSKGIKAKKASK